MSRRRTPRPNLRARRVPATVALGLLLLSAASTPLLAQQQPARTLVGVGASMGAMSIETSIPYYGTDRSCGEWTDGSATPIGGSALLRLPSIAGGLGGTLRLGLLSQTASFAGPPVYPQRQVDPQTGMLVDVTREIRLESSLSTLHLDALAGYSIAGFSLWAGPSFGIRLGADQSVADAIVAPSFPTFRGGAREVVVPIAPELTGSTVALGFVGDLAYTLALGPKLHISPHVGFRLDPSSPYEGFDWTQSTFGGGVDVLLDMTPAPTPEPEPVPIAIDPEPERPRETEAIAPAVELTLQALDTNGAPTLNDAEVIYREHIERRHVPVIPAVFFDSASVALPVRLRRYEADDKPSDVARSLAELSTMDAQASVLNVIGERLRANPRLAVTLVGSTSGDEQRTLATQRAAAVRDYLVDVWRLDASQIVLSDDRRSLRLSNEANAEGREENRRVQIVASSADVLRPVFVERTLEQATVPLRVRLLARSSAPVERWRIGVEAGGRELVAIDTSARTLWEIDRRIEVAPERLDASATTLTADAVASGARGLNASARTSIPVTWRREQTFVEGGTEQNAGRERTTWQVLGLAYNSSELLERHRDELRTIAGLVRSSARIVVTGYSDRLGEPTRNLELSRERAESVAAALRQELARRGRTDVVVESSGAGVDETRFSNDVPEGRFLSRGVTIVVEQEARTD